MEVVVVAVVIIVSDDGDDDGYGGDGDNGDDGDDVREGRMMDDAKYSPIDSAKMSNYRCDPDDPAI
jgi:hypothetical protein